MIRTRSYLKDHGGVLITGLALLSMTSMPRAAWAQWQTSNSNIYYNNGSVGIGTNAPWNPLQVNTSGTNAAYFYGTNTWATWIGIQNGTSGGGAYLLGVGGSPGVGSLAIFDQIAGAYRLSINSNGNIGIGTTNPQHLLHVAGTIGAEEILVTSSGADYVFEPGYRLRPLSEVAGYIQANHHLPDIPSADEVKQKGMGVGEMQAKLLAKVEELTLHMIQAEERNNRLEEQNQELRDRLARLEKSANAPTADK
jgi:hypothetical protein